MKLNDFRHLCDNVCSKEVSLLCFVKFIALVSFRCRKKKIYEKSEVPAKTKNKKKQDLGSR